MLVLTRNIGESIFIDGKKIKICLLGRWNGQLKIGIEAPKGMEINREELFYKKYPEEIEENFYHTQKNKIGDGGI